jgi:protein disulfide-isomerase
MHKNIIYPILLALLLFSGIKAQETNEVSNNTKTKKMKVEIWSDIVCPFCYIGKRHFESALKSFAHADEIEIEWKSYQLDPEMPKQTKKQNVYEYLAERKGISVENSKALHDNVVKMAKSAGLDYHFEKAVVANSFDAHRLIQLAKTKGLGDAAEEALFYAYFSAGKDIADKESLLAIGKEIDLEENAVKELLNTDLFSEQVDQDVYESQQVELGGVPHFVIDDRFSISGAQPVSVFLNALEKAYQTRGK